MIRDHTGILPGPLNSLSGPRLFLSFSLASAYPFMLSVVERLISMTSLRATQAYEQRVRLPRRDSPGVLYLPLYLVLDPCCTQGSLRASVLTSNLFSWALRLQELPCMHFPLQITLGICSASKLHLLCQGESTSAGGYYLVTPREEDQVVLNVME